MCVVEDDALGILDLLHDAHDEVIPSVCLLAVIAVFNPDVCQVVVLAMLVFV